nr:MAG TPA: hypothetical protein [Caudoviricetes sp.]
MEAIRDPERLRGCGVGVVGCVRGRWIVRNSRTS